MNVLHNYVAVDIETTGLNPLEDNIIEIGAIRYVDGLPSGCFKSFIKPGIKLPQVIINLTGITDTMLKDAPAEEQVMEDFMTFAGEDVLLGHNVIFDYSFLKTAAIRHNHIFDRNGIDTLSICRSFHMDMKSKSLDSMCVYYGISRERAHRAYDDAKAAAELYMRVSERFFDQAPEIFLAKPLYYKVKKKEPMTHKQRKYLMALVNFHQVTLQREVETLSKSEASRLIDSIISTNGRIV